MSRPRPEEERRAFGLWLADTKRTKQSMIQIADAVNRPVATLYDWHERYDWPGEESRLADDAVAAALLRMRSGISAAVDRLIRIAESPKSTDRDAINAAKVILPYVLGASGQSDAGGNVYVDKLLVTEVGKLPTAELLKLASGGLEDNLNTAQMQRASKRQVVPKV